MSLAADYTGFARLTEQRFPRSTSAVVYRAVGAYHQSKIANLMLTVELAERWKQRGVTANALHPGLVRTDLTATLSPLNRFAEWLTRPWARTPEQGADPPLYLAASDEVAGITGQYFIDRRPRPERINRDARDAGIRARL